MLGFLKTKCIIQWYAKVRNTILFWNFLYSVLILFPSLLISIFNFFLVVLFIAFLKSTQWVKIVANIIVKLIANRRRSFHNFVHHCIIQPQNLGRNLKKARPKGLQRKHQTSVTMWSNDGAIKILLLLLLLLFFFFYFTSDYKRRRFYVVLLSLFSPRLRISITSATQTVFSFWSSLHTYLPTRLPAYPLLRICLSFLPVFVLCCFCPQAFQKKARRATTGLSEDKQLTASPWQPTDVAMDTVSRSRRVSLKLSLTNSVASIRARN